MNRHIYKTINILQATILPLCLYSALYTPLIIIFFLLCLLRLLVKIGDGSFFLELLHVYGAFTCLLMPLIGYTYFNKVNEMGLIYGKIMPVSFEEYFSFALPSIVIMGLGFFLFRGGSSDDRSTVKYFIQNIKIDILKIRPSQVLFLTFVALIAYVISEYLPVALKQVNTFLYYSLFACGFYIFFYKNFPAKVYFLTGLVGFIVLDAINSGMFTIIAYMSGLFLILIIAERRIPFYQKATLLVSSLLLIGFIQLFKLDLRKSYKMGETVSTVELASRVVASSQQSTFAAILYPLYLRMNQGYNIALVQKRIPAQVDYLGGEYLGLSLLSSFVPRLFWPDKPEAGGKENMKIYTGVLIDTWSTNVGPLGEAYGNFGMFGGWVYILAFSLFLRWAYLKFLSICVKRPIFFLWLPPVFFQTFYVMETDSLQATNSLIKGAIFMFAMFKLLPHLFPAKQS